MAALEWKIWRVELIEAGVLLELGDAPATACVQPYDRVTQVQCRLRRAWHKVMDRLDAIRKAAQAREGTAPNTQHPTPSTQHPTPNTQHPAPITQHPTPITQHPAPSTPHPTPNTHHPAPSPHHPTPSTRSRAPRHSLESKLDI